MGHQMIRLVFAVDATRRNEPITPHPDAMACVDKVVLPPDATPLTDCLGHTWPAAAT